MKIAVFMIGPGAAGKTTARRAFNKGTPESFRTQFTLIDRNGNKREDEEFHYSLYDNCAVAGTPNCGTDANVSPDSIQLSFAKCLENRDLAIVDGVMGSPVWALMCNEYPELHVICVHFALSEETVFGRLLKRRALKGKVETELPDKTKENSRSFIKRALSTMKHFRTKCNRPMYEVLVKDEATTEDIVALITAQIEAIHDSVID